MPMKGWVSVLLVHLVRDTKLIEKAQGKLQPAHLEREVSSDHVAYIWTCSSEYYLKYKKTIPKHYLLAGIAERAEKNGIALDDATIEEVGAFVDWIYSIPDSDMEHETGMEYLKQLLVDVHITSPLQAMLSSGSDMSEIYEALQQGMNVAAVSAVEPLDPLAEFEMYQEASKPMPLGGTDIMYFNQLTNGGMAPGEVMMMVGPTGGFKTMMAVDIVCSMAMVQQYSMFCSYEQAFKSGDLPNRFMSRMSGISKEYLRNTKLDTMPADVKEKIRQAKQYGQYIQFMDRSQHIDKIEDIGGQVQDAINRGKKPEFIIVDQLLTWVSKWPELQGGDPKILRTMARDILLSLKREVCEKYGTRLLLLHQVPADVLKSGAGKALHITDSAECKSMAFWADFAVAMGVRTTQDVFILSCGKNRCGVLKAYAIQAHPEFCKFSLSETYKVDEQGLNLVSLNPHMLPNDQRMSKPAVQQLPPLRDTFAMPGMAP